MVELAETSALLRLVELAETNALQRSVKLAETSVPFGNFGKLSYRSGNNSVVELAETSVPFGMLRERIPQLDLAAPCG